MNNNFLTQIAAAVRDNPSDAARIYAIGAAQLRNAARNPKNGKHVGALLSAATKMDELAAHASVPDRDFDGELIQEFAPMASVPSDFAVLVSDIANAESAEPNDELAQYAKMQEIQLGREREIAQPVRITPESLRDTTVLGNIETVTYGVEPSEKPVVWWDGKEQEAQTATVTIGRAENTGGSTFPAPSQASPVVPFTYRPYARIKWGARGFLHEALVDVNRGSQITLSASHIYVSVGMGATASGATAGTMSLAATIGFFATARQTQNTFTVYLDSAASGVRSALIVIPKFAQSVMVYREIQSTYSGNQTDLAVYDNNSTVIYSQRFTGAEMVTPTWLSDDAYYVAVAQTNGNGSASNMRVVFGLAL